jgi:hypothetical protein
MFWMRKRANPLVCAGAINIAATLLSFSSNQ